MPRIEEEYRMEITEKIIEALENGTAPWQKPWLETYMPVNATTGKRYSGMNSILLSMKGDKLSENGDPRWATRKQAEKMVWLIKFGEKPLKISFFIMARKSKNGGFKSKRIKFIESEDDKNKKSRPFWLQFDVYHASQIKGIPAFVAPNTNFKREEINNRVIDKIIFNASARVYEGGDEAYYSPSSDIIRMPSKNYFSDTEGYYSTLLHELAHWTGHNSRLDRITSFDRRSASYAREELVAEIASMFLAAEFGIPQTQEHFGQHAAYINSWIKLLQSNSNVIFDVTKEAQKAANYILMFKEVEIKLAS